MRFLLLTFALLFSFLASAQNEVIYIWSGAVTSHSVKVNAKMTDTSITIRLICDEDSTFSSPIYSPYYSVDTSTNMMVSMVCDGLLPATKYFYCVESAGIMDSSADDVGSFKTFGNGPYSFSFTAGSCVLNSDHQSYVKMKEFHPDFYINLGDLHYNNPNSGIDINVHRDPYESQVLSKPAAAALFREVPIAYMWDDHDFSGNNSDSSALGKENARRAYHEYVPHYPLGLGEGPDHPICQSFDVGRFHFVLTDLRSERSFESFLGTDQRAWFENECAYVKNNNKFMVWISSCTWNNTTEASDNWGYGAAIIEERNELSDIFVFTPITNMFMVCGDAHMLGIDDGTNGDFATTPNWNKYPIFQTGAVNQNGSYKGGIYNQGGCFLNPDYTWGQFGRIIVDDDGSDSVCVTFEGYRVDSSGSNFSMLDTYTFCRAMTHVGIVEQKRDVWAHLLGNPSPDLLIYANADIDLQGIRIFDMKGMELADRKCSGHNFTWKDNGLKQGCYLIELQTDKGAQHLRWIKTEN
jgi:alkaline phosphatase D